LEFTDLGFDNGASDFLTDLVAHRTRCFDIRPRQLIASDP
jgi:hypothetical protein